MASKRASFLSHLPKSLQAEAKALKDLEQRLTALRSQGETAWPTLPLQPSVFVSALGARAEASPPEKGLAQWLDHVQPEDFHLAIACEEGLSGAVAAFETHYREDLERLTRKYEGPEMLADDLLQHLRERLFVSSTSRRAKIQSYSGQGRLQNWLRVTATRMFIDMLRSASRRHHKDVESRGSEHLLAVPDTMQDLELDFLKREHRAHFKEAFAVAVHALNPHERNLLRQHLVHQRTVEQIGAVYGVHASTISRRMTKARETLQTATRREFMNRLEVKGEEYESIIRMIRSRLDVSIQRLLQTRMVPDDEDDSKDVPADD